MTAVGLIQHGSVELSRRHGVRRVVLQVLHAGDVYGDIPYLLAITVGLATIVRVLRFQSLRIRELDATDS